MAPPSPEGLALVPMLAAGLTGCTMGSLAFGSAVDTRALLKLASEGETSTGEWQGI